MPQGADLANVSVLSRDAAAWPYLFHARHAGKTQAPPLFSALKAHRRRPDPMCQKQEWNTGRSEGGYGGCYGDGLRS